MKKKRKSVRGKTLFHTTVHRRGDSQTLGFGWVSNSKNGCICSNPRVKRKFICSREAESRQLFYFCSLSRVLTVTFSTTVGRRECRKRVGRVWLRGRFRLSLLVMACMNFNSVSSFGALHQTARGRGALLAPFLLCLSSWPELRVSSRAGVTQMRLSIHQLLQLR